jgi:hypothetical protein
LNEDLDPKDLNPLTLYGINAEDYLSQSTVRGEVKLPGKVSAKLIAEGIIRRGKLEGEKAHQ